MPVYPALPANATEGGPQIHGSTAGGMAASLPTQASEEAKPPQREGRDPKFLWLAGGAFAIAAGALLWASTAKTTRAPRATLGKVRKFKLARAIPAK